MKRYDVIDCFRGIAAVSVVLLHYTYGYRIHYGHFYSPDYDFKYGYLGVPFFFIISGFVIYLTLNNCASVYKFLYKRFSRLYPIFWACMLTTFLIVHFFGLPGREKSFYNIKGNLTMIPTVFGYSAIDGAYWSLVPEFFFYITMALLFVNRFKHSYILWGMLVITLSWINKFLFSFPGIFQTVLNLKYGALFFAGILFYQLQENKFYKPYQINSLLLLSLFTIMINLNTVIERLIVGGFYILFYLFVYKKLEWLRWKPLLFLGQISFPLYLLHQNIGYVIMNHIKPFVGTYPIAFIGFTVLIIFFLAYAYHVCIEVPSIKFLRMGKSIFKNNSIKTFTH